MTLTQLEYIVAVDTHRHFVTAAGKCFVTQPTLSMQIQKLEEELGVMIFDRSKQPVIPTEYGIGIIAQARKVLQEAGRLREIIHEKKNVIEGTLNFGIIPTLAPYLLPLFLMQFSEKYPALKLTIEELTTEEIIRRLKSDLLDCGLLATPLHEQQITEIPLFYEPFVAYIGKGNALFKKTTVSADELNMNEMLLLSDTHCLAAQVVNLCKHGAVYHGNIDYKAGSIETLKKMVELNNGVTIIPELATLDMSSKQQGMVRYFRDPEPVREISLVIHRSFVKKRLIEVLMDEIRQSIPEKMKIKEKKQVVKLR